MIKLEKEIEDRSCGIWRIIKIAKSGDVAEHVPIFFSQFCKAQTWLSSLIRDQEKSKVDSYVQSAQPLI